jgi:hypothetical protein
MGEVQYHPLGLSFGYPSPGATFNATPSVPSKGFYGAQLKTSAPILATYT